MPEPVDYATIIAAVEPTGMVVRGGFLVEAGADGVAAEAPSLDDGRSCRTIVVIGNIGGTMWPRFRREQTSGPNPLDRWTRSVLRPIAAELGASFVHPSDEPFQPFQRWAQRADDVWPSPIGLLVHARFGLWHAYRGAFVFADVVTGLPVTGTSESPCLTCVAQPCLSTCPVDAFGPEGYDSGACTAHVRSGDEPTCLDDGCAARRACPVGVDVRYGPDQMRFHMEAFVGSRS